MNLAPNISPLMTAIHWIVVGIACIAGVGFLALLFEVHVDNDGSLDKKIRRWWQR